LLGNFSQLKEEDACNDFVAGVWAWVVSFDKGCENNWHAGCVSEFYLALIVRPQLVLRSSSKVFFNCPPIYSILKLVLKPQDSGIQVIFNHTVFPEVLKAHLATDGSDTIGMRW